jgi:hypothetical protein
MKLYMFRTVLLSIIRSLFTVHSAMVYVIQVCRQLSSRIRIRHAGLQTAFEQNQDGTAVPSWSCSTAVCTVPVWRIPLLSVQWINSWWWTDELFETCRVSWQNNFVKFLHLIGFITKKYQEYFITTIRKGTCLSVPVASWGTQFIRCVIVSCDGILFSH